VYFSGVTFTSLGYGDVVLPRQVRLLAPLQAANGLMMFGISTALFIACVETVTRRWASRRQHKNASGAAD
jgi:CBS domain containing-hemolysin-like protein